MTTSDPGDATPDTTPAQPQEEQETSAPVAAPAAPPPTQATTANAAPPNAERDAMFRRLQVLLLDSRRILQRMAHSFPSTGLDALGQGERLACLLDRMLLWDALILGEAHPDANSSPGLTLDDATWARLEARWPAAQQRLGAQAPTEYPAFLRAFCHRHSALQTPSSGEFGDNDLELETLWRPANQLQGVLETALWEWQSSQPDPPPRKDGWRRWIFWLVLAAVAGSYVYAGFTRPKRPLPGPPKGALAGGIQGAYFQGTQFQKLKRRRVDKGIWFHWQASPISGITPNYFSIRWAGYLKAPTPGRYKLCMRHDDGINLRLDGRVRVNKWRRGKDAVHCSTTELTRGWHRLVVHMFDRYGPAIAKLSWQPPGAKNPKKIPAQHLCCRNL